MRLISLTAKICKTFSDAASDNLRTIQKVKQDQVRDVVTELDVRLHDVSASYTLSQLTDCRLLSEEGVDDGVKMNDILSGKWLIVDPLDGSNNYALDLPGYGYMAAYVDAGLVEASCIVLPEYDQYIVYEKGDILFSQPLGNIDQLPNAPVYYAYPPQQDQSAFETRLKLQKFIDSSSSGIYRYGSACIGLYNLILGKHLAFIGHQIRVWDAIAFLPILRSCNIEVYYCLEGLSITLVASRNHETLINMMEIFQQRKNIALQEYVIGNQLRVI